MWRRTLAIALIAGGAVPAAAQVRTDERVDVARVLVDARVTDRAGQPVRGLDVADFRVVIDGRPARVESASWIGFDRARAPVSTQPLALDGPTPIQPGRLTVFMFQTSLERSRVGGTLQMMRESARFVDRLGPADRAAVVVFDSRLRVWQDFTADRVRLSNVLGRGVLFEPPSEETAAGISLVSSLDPGAAERAGSMEEALLVVARALRPIEGAKSLVIFGHGFGRFVASAGSPTGPAVLGRDYDEARTALIAARVTVFAMDITDAETHTLETGLMAAAEDTGGFYAKVNTQQSAAMDRLEGALDGYYLLAVENPAVRAGRHEIRVKTTISTASVSARRYYID
jgi:VWFA-related protein